MSLIEKFGGSIMAKEQPHETPSNNDVHITAIFMICLIGLLVVWSTGVVSVPQLWRDAMHSVGSDAPVVQKDGAALPL